MTPNTRDIALILAKAHKAADPGTTLVKFFPEENTQEIRLLEVSKNSPSLGNVYPFRFGPAGDIIFSSIVILLSPKEWKAVKSGKLPLPTGWDLKSAEDL